MSVLSYNENEFLMDGKPFRILSGAIHYFRVPRAYWHDRLLKLKECGFNTVETYTCWNLHEPREGEFDFSGDLDLGAFIRTAGALGLYVILRPGPYICAEWEFGGLPAWLLTYRDMAFRCHDEAFLSKVRRYYNALLPQVRPFLASRGGNLIMLQVENEYGSYGNDGEYLRAIADIYRENGMDCLYFTSDGPSYTMLNGGTMQEHLAVVNFGSGTNRNLDFLKAFRPQQPVMCGEFWCGWFDHWFEEHHVRPVGEVIGEFSAFLSRGASLNYYMFHGGTNFGFHNGANHEGAYQPIVTSYDYNAPLNEAGDRTPLYYRIRELVEKADGPLPPPTAHESDKADFGEVELTECAPLFENIKALAEPVFAAAPRYMEDLGQDFGFVLYRTYLKGPQDDWPLTIEEVHDRAQIFADGRYLGTFERWDPKRQKENPIRLPLKDGETLRLDILAENMGRVNYGSKLIDRKGVQRVMIGRQQLFRWEHYSLPMKDLRGLSFRPITEKAFSGPVFLRGRLNVAEPKDTFLYPSHFKKGFVIVNGHNLGRYFNEAGPQKTLYLPAPFLKTGENEIILFESDGYDASRVALIDHMILQ